MANRPAKFTQADLTRALKGAISAGLTVAGFSIDPNGRIVVRTATTPEDDGPNEWDTK